MAVAALPSVKFNVKVGARANGPVDYRAFIPVFHRLIQQQKLGGILVDVAEYTHVAKGPQVLLVAHEGQWILDDAQGRLGLVYSQRHPPEAEAATPEQALTRALREALAGCAVLEAEPEAKAAGLVFEANRLEFTVNDRLAAPNTSASYDVLEPLVKSVAGRALSGAALTLARETEPRRRCGVSVTAPGPVSAAQALSRLG